MRVAVVGGGAVGVTATADLAEAGVDVRLYERDETLGDTDAIPGQRVVGSSRRAAGVLAPRPTTDHGAAVAERALERIERLAAHDSRLTFEPCPQVTVASAREAADRLRDQVAASQAVGVDVSLVEPAALGDRYPLATADLTAAAVTERAGYVAPGPGAYVAAMADRARAAGAEIWTGVDADLSYRGDGPRVDRERFDAVVVAAGAWTNRVLAPTGVSLPVKPYRVQALVSGAEYDGPMVLDADAGCYFRPHPTGLLAGDGTVPEAVDPERWSPDADEWFIEDTREVLAGRADHELTDPRAWAGVCTATPDGEPLLGEVRDGLFVATGWQGHGFLRAPAMGERLAAQVLGEPGEPAFDPNRVASDVEFEIREGMEV